MNDISISIYLDGRRKKANGRFPIKLRVYNPKSKKAVLYPLSKIKTQAEDKSLILETIREGLPSQKSLDSILYADRPRNETKKLKFFFNELMQSASTIAESLTPFTFDEFENRLFDNKTDGRTLISCYQLTIDNFKNKNSFSTASNYELSKKSLQSFAAQLNKQLTFDLLTPKFLQEYEDYMLNELDRSVTTVSMYLRALRAVLNKAIRDKIILEEQYPFGRHKYTIPTGDKVIKALTKEQLSAMLKGKALTPEQQTAKDYWFFSYFSQGMNIKDIALLKFEDVKQDSIQYYRAKTKSAGKKKPRNDLYNNESIYSRFHKTTQGEKRLCK